MKLIITFLVSVLYNVLMGTFLFHVGTKLIPERQRHKFFEIVPLYPKRKYLIILYGTASIIYTLLANEGYGGIFVALFTVIVASQLTRGIAKIRGEQLEETYEEEMERKREQW